MLPSRVKRMTYCQLEVDAHAIDIVNKSSIRGLQTNPGLQAIWESEKIRRKVQNRSSQFTAEETHSRKMEKIHATELMYKERLVTKLKNIALRVNSSLLVIKVVSLFKKCIQSIRMQKSFEYILKDFKVSVDNGFYVTKMLKNS